MGHTRHARVLLRHISRLTVPEDRKPMPEALTKTKAKGDCAELAVAHDLLHRSHKVALPYGEDWDYDLIVAREARLGV